MFLYSELTTCMNASVVSLAPPTAESERDDTFFPTICDLAAELNLLIYCWLSLSPLVIVALATVMSHELSVERVKLAVTLCLPWSVLYVTLLDVATSETIVAAPSVCDLLEEAICLVDEESIVPVVGLVCIVV